MHTIFSRCKLLTEISHTNNSQAQHYDKQRRICFENASKFECNNDETHDNEDVDDDSEYVKIATNRREQKQPNLYNNNRRKTRGND